MKKTQVNKSHYYNLDYDSLERWISYWRQIKEIVALKPKKILEIGPGSGIVANTLRSYGIKVVTLDIDKKTKPDICADLLNIPKRAKSFDVILCSQVLEHLPYDEFAIALKEFSRISNNLVLSLPHPGPVLSLQVKIPLVPRIEQIIKFPLPIKHRFNGQHYWEIGKISSFYGSVLNTIRQYYKIKKNYIYPGSPWHRFFVLKSLK
jgi:methyltransferase family protein